MNNLPSISYRVFYSPNDRPLETFYLPSLAASVQYDRSAGYFRSSALAAAAAGIVRLIGNGGRMRLLVGASLTQQDIAAIQQGHDLRQTVGAALLAHFPDPADGDVRQRLAALAWMVAHGRLEIKVVLPLDKHGRPIPGDEAHDYYHPKKGIFTDAAGNQVGFSGSINETAQGWRGNFEEFSVCKSWGGDYERSLLGNYQASFKQLWEGRDPHWVAVDLPEAVRARLVSYAPAEQPVTDALEPQPEPVIADGRQPWQVVSERDRILFQFLRDAPYLLQARDLGEATSAIAPWPHQQQVARSVLDRFPDRVLLCDEVGLGKTIEAGLIIRQLLLSGRARRILILAPASVMRQWQEELYEKFVLDVPLFDKGLVTNVAGEVLEKTQTPWATHAVLIMSSHLARRQERRQQLLAAEPWDALVVDEAHHARRKDFKQKQYRPNSLLTLLNGLRDARQYTALLLMTATPMQVHPVEVWDLLMLLGMSGRWGADEVNYLAFFDELRRAAGAFLDAQWDFVFDMVGDYLRGDGWVDERFAAELTAKVGPVHAHVIQSLYSADGNPTQVIKTLPKTAQPYVVEMARRHTPLQRYVFRNTRDLLRQYVREGLLNATVPTRRPHIERIDLRSDERELYDRITEYISQFYQRYEAEKRGLGFIMTIYRRRLTSSFCAVRCSLEKRRHWIEGVLTADQLLSPIDLADDDDLWDAWEQLGFDIDDFEQIGDARRVNFQEELAYLNDFIGALRELSLADSKLTRLIHQLNASFHRRDTAIVFTQYTDTMDYLREQLRTVYGSSVACYSGRGGEVWNGIAWVKTTKEEVKNRFRAAEYKILLCTESASEGLNLQTCGVLFNYDMPWNPMRVEQRIGRIDRIGQTFAEVWIHNYFYRDTIEDLIYAALADRINWFEAVVGDLQPILAEIEAITRELAMLPAEQQKARFQQTIKAVRKNIDQAQMAAFKLDENLQHTTQQMTTQAPVNLEGLRDCLVNNPATAHLFQPHPELGDAYLLDTAMGKVAVTFSRPLFDSHPNSLKLLSYGNALLSAVLAGVAAPVDLGGVQRFTADEPYPLRGWYDGSGRAIDSLGALVAALNGGGAAAGEAISAAAAFDEVVAARRQEDAERRRELVARQRRTLTAQARQILHEAALVEIALGQQQSLFSTESYPTRFSPTAVTGLMRHGDVWKWLVKIGEVSRREIRPQKSDAFYQAIAGVKRAELEMEFGRLTRCAKQVVVAWRRFEQASNMPK